MPSNVVLSTQEFNVVGTRPIRHDGADKVTGRARYGADIHLPGLLHGKVLRSPHPHARIKSIDASRALALLSSAAAVRPPSTLILILSEISRWLVMESSIRLPIL